MKRPDDFKPPEASGLKPTEIAAIVLALAVPVALIVLLLTPGAMKTIVLSFMDRSVLWAACLGGAALLTVVVGVRAWNRARRRKTARKEDRPQTFWDHWRDPYR